MRVVPVYGGQPIDRQFRALRDGAQVVVGTPGRVLDHLKRGTLTLDSLRLCVLDEADEMLALGFLEEVEGILAQMPEERQVAFFSATMPPRIAALTQKYLRNPARVVIASQGRTVDTTNQSYYEVPPGQKLEVLGRVLALETPGPTIIFCRTRQETNDVAEALRQRGYNAEPLHGDMNQSERDRVMLRFRQGQADILVATDVAARGLDIETVTHVINFDIPWDVEQYIHRVGRTGRAGRTGDAITLVSGRERQQLKYIERFIGAPIRWAKVPTLGEIAQRRRELFQESVRATVIEGGHERQLAMVEALASEHDVKAVAAAALKMLWESRHGAHADEAEAQDAIAQRMAPPMTKVYVGLGRRDGLRPGDLVGAIANEANLKARSIGEIEILDAVSFVEVPTSETERVVAALRRTKLRGRKVKVALLIG
jgi:ATP-dependent RNA helicase DeaD